MKTKLEQYADMVKNRLKNIKNIKKLLAEENSPELNYQLNMETYSLHQLLADSYYAKLLKKERQELIMQYVKKEKNYGKNIKHNAM